MGQLPDGPFELSWGDLVFDRQSSKSTVGAATIPAGSSLAVIGEDIDGRHDLAKALAGLGKPAQGLIRVGQFESTLAASGRGCRLVGYAGEKEIFHGTLSENVALGRPGIDQTEVRKALTQVGLADVVLRLPAGLQTKLQTNGYPLSAGQLGQLLVARAIVAKPKVVVINRVLDELAADWRNRIWEALTGPDATWTLVVVTDREDLAALCDSQISVRS